MDRKKFEGGWIEGVIKRGVMIKANYDRKRKWDGTRKKWTPCSHHTLDMFEYHLLSYKCVNIFSW
jgi:hypothetical protein